MSQSHENPSHEVSAINVNEAHPKLQQNILEGQTSFTELKESCHMQAECQQYKQLEQCMNQQVSAQGDDLISIKTYNERATSLRSVETLLMEQEKDSEKMDNCEHVQIKGDNSEGSSNKESIKMDNIEQEIKKECPQLDGISLTQTTPFQVLQEKVKPESPKNEGFERTFTLAHTQEITIDHGICRNNEQKVDLIAEALNNALLQRKSKLCIAKTIQEKHNPTQLENKQEQANKVEQPIAGIQTNKDEAKVQAPEAKQQNTPKSEPFKLQSLYVSSLRSNSVIKPPEPVAEKKPKIWQMFKNKKQSKEPAPASPTKQSQKINITAQNTQQKPASENNPTTNTVSEDGSKINASIQAQKQQTIEPIKQPLKQEEPRQTLSNAPQTPKIQQKKPHKPLFDDRGEKNEDAVQFHKTKHHPLERPSFQQKEKPQLQSKASIQPQESTNLTSVVDNTDQTELKPQQPQINAQRQKEEPKQQKQQEKQIEMEPQQSQASPSQRQEMLVDYTHDKHYQLQLHKMNRQKIKQLEQRLRNQEELNRQLQKSLSFPTKLLTSAAIGASTAGLAWVAKKNKNLSILLGFATTLASFILSD